ncbi:2,5-didehydrogluconate reductase [Catenulispora acidiphila DSM 44928]|uniref:2,5-didehydrogluconate reductase n=1 Tax=Catenulispora acidiphila (strain DSM 44928 / JCM 14897 / NBRC 102108 / NRRL B-24433 / ID139908) TaxID=479433 RepID=C7Q5Y9_CATAD|nr:aldo/keto reductase [Catenulispora acidiphila]ACU70086.1 2,5-didehydrogluconate reductase [Catenulispora acidiphila DSM 44928]
MQYITLNDGVQIPQVGLGVWRVSDAEAYGAVTTALEAGYRHVDTAAAYENEGGVGRAIRDSGIPRKDVFLTTKLWNGDHGYDAALRAFDKSLERLGTEYVDLYLIHWPVPEQDLYIESWRALEKIHSDGRARAIGVSNFSAETLERLVKESKKVPSINQIELHPYFCQPAMRQLNEKLGIVTEDWSPLGQGGDLLQEPVLTRIGDAKGKTAAQVVLRWHIQLGDVVIPKSVTASRIVENIDVFDFELTSAEMDEITELRRDDGRIGPDPDHFNYVG